MEYDNPLAGLYFDAGLRTAGETDMEIINLARGYGFVTEDEPDADCEFVGEIADEATDFLNALETREGYFWGYGDNAEGFGLWANGEEQR